MIHSVLSSAGDPFLAKYPASFLGTGIVATPLPRGVPLGIGEADGRGGDPEEDICFFGTVLVRHFAALQINGCLAEGTLW